jgi:hypothetical protein
LRTIVEHSHRPDYSSAANTVRKDQIRLEAERLERLYRECDGWAQRVHEKLVEEEGAQVSYPTVTRWLRELCSLDIFKTSSGSINRFFLRKLRET